MPEPNSTGNEHPEQEPISDLRHKPFFILDQDFYNYFVPQIGMPAALVYMALCYHANKGTCFPRKALIARELGIAERTVQTALTALEAHKLITITARKRPDGSNASNLYTILPVPDPRSGDGDRGSLPGDLNAPRPGDPQAPHEPDSESEQESDSLAKKPRAKKEKDPEPAKLTVELKNAMAEICYGKDQISQAWAGPITRSQMLRAFKTLFAYKPDLSADDLIDFEKRWHKDHWRGQRGNAPIPGQIAEQWLVLMAQPKSDPSAIDWDKIDWDKIPSVPSNAAGIRPPVDDDPPPTIDEVPF